jgi:thymine-DNA glycosylase
LTISGSKVLLEKIKKYNPKIAVFNGKGIYEVFSSQKAFPLGKQPEKFEGTETVLFRSFLQLLLFVLLFVFS